LHKPRSIVALTVLICTAALALSAAAQGPRFLTAEKSNADPLDLAMSYIRGMDKARLMETDLADLAVVDRYVSKHNGTTHIYLRQRVGGIDVINSHTAVNVAADGRIINLDDNLVRGLKAAVNAKTPALSAEKAIRYAADHLGLEISGLLKATEKAAGPAQRSTFTGAGLSLDPIPAKLVYFALEDGSVRLAWDLVVRTQIHWWNLWVDAASGDVLAESDWVDQDTYQVFALPKESPSDGPRTIETDPADATASPYGWHDFNGSPGAEYTITWGNNVRAQEDRDANNSGGFSPDGGAGLDFQYPLDLATESPVDYQDAAITNLFYWNNLMHDLLFQYGFDEASGNFQYTNYSGAPGNLDPVLADAQDGSGTNNANFGTPQDGFAPRMQMYEWTYPFSQQVTVNSPPSIAGTYIANPSNDGGTGMGLTADLAIVDDGVAPTDDGCETVTNDLTGKIGLLLWNEGACNSSVFVANVAAAGAVAVIIIDNTDEPRTNFGGSPAIPSVAVGLTDGQLIMSTITGGDTVNATLEDSTDGTPDRDSDLDNGVIAHEYCHGLSNRLTGGRTQVNCLNNQQQAGEGWSDFCALVFTAEASDTDTTDRGVGNYVSFLPPDGPGIRDFPYTTDMGVNPFTYSDIGSVSVPHGVGSVWNTMLWEVYWNLTNAYGFDSDLYNGTGGNNLAIQLVVDGLKLQACNPTFIEARDAILLADQNNNGGANECLIWEGFAKRGLGYNATDGGGGLTVTDNFDLPPQCVVGCGNGICESGEDCNSCPGDCVSGTSSGAVCGNGTCEAGNGEDCVSCPADCNGVQGGKPSNRFCCGDGDGQNPLPCSDPACSTGGWQCTDVPVPGGSYCCGDLSCDSGEDCSNCALDCTLGAEVCSGGIDEDCNGFVDCEDGACTGDPICQAPDCSQFNNKSDCNAATGCRWDNKNKVCVAQ
jgi:hypothetical protein